MNPRIDTRFFVKNGQLEEVVNFPEYLVGSLKSVYEVLKVVDGRPIFLPDHFQRFDESLASMQCRDYSINQEIFENLIYMLFESNSIKNGNIRVDYFVETGETYFYVIPHYYPPECLYSTGVKTVSLKYTRENPNAKVNNSWLKSVVATMMDDENTYEVVLINEHGQITEGSRTNVFFVKGSTVQTADGTMVLKGISASKVKYLCHKLNLSMVEEAASYDQVFNFDAMFLTGTSIGVLPVSNFDGIFFNADNGVVRSLVESFKILEKDEISRAY